jgi:uncharacterized protein YciI
VKYVVFYEVADGDVMPRIREHNPAHRARWAQFHARGDLLMIGPFTDLRDGAMAVFTTREAAEEFVGGDPFVLHGVVSTWRIAEWMEALVPDAPSAPDPAGAPS